MSAWIRDLQLSARTLRRTPAMAIVAVLALTLGIGLTTMMFSIVYGAMMRGLPYEGGDRIVVVQRANAERDIQRQGLRIRDFVDVRDQQKSFSHLAAYTSGTMNVSGREKAERFSGSWISRGLLDMTGTGPLMGRTFREEELVPGGPKAALLGYAMWQSYLGGDPSVLGTTLRVNGESHEVVGIMPDGFRFPSDDQLWLPMQTDPSVGDRGEGPFVTTFGKLAPEVSVQEANAELGTIAARLAADYPAANKGFSMYALPFVEQAIGREPRQLLLTMLGAVFFVLLIACTNVANLLLDRAAHRSKEVGVRKALGGSRAGIARIFLSEAMVLAAIGTILGVALAHFAIDAFNRAIVDTQPPFFINIALHPPVLLFAIGVTALSTMLAGLIPGIQASRSDISEVLKDESRGSSSLKLGRLSKGLVIFEIALSCGLLVAAGLMIKSVAKTRNMDTGFTSENVFTARIGFPAGFRDSTAQQQFFRELQTRVSALPGVQSAALSSGLPGAQQGFNGSDFALDGVSYEREQDLPDVRTLSVSQQFFETLEIPLRQGRTFTEGDRAGSLDVGIVTERFARQFLSGADPIGRRVRLGGLESVAPWITIVGVVPDVFGGDPSDPRPAALFRPMAQVNSAFAYVSVRTGLPPLDMTQPVREAVASLEPDLPIYWPMTYAQAIEGPLWFVRIFGTMFMIFGFVALFLASIGLYAVMSFSVSRRSREMGVRMALGSSTREVIALVLRQGAWQLVIGLAAGLAFAAVISRVMTVVLFDVKPLDVVVFGGVAAVLALAGLTACLIPARRATGVDPAIVMRSE